MGLVDVVRHWADLEPFQGLTLGCAERAVGVCVGPRSGIDHVRRTADLRQSDGLVDHKWRWRPDPAGVIHAPTFIDPTADFIAGLAGTEAGLALVEEIEVAQAGGGEQNGGAGHLMAQPQGGLRKRLAGSEVMHERVSV
jgi:hypothetical protein